MDVDVLLRALVLRDPHHGRVTLTPEELRAAERSTVTTSRNDAGELIVEAEPEHTTRAER